MKTQAGTEDIIAKQSIIGHLLQRQLQALDSQGIFGTDVDVALGGADSIGADEHAFQNGVRVSF